MECRRNVTPTKTYLFFVSDIILYRHGSSVSIKVFNLFLASLLNAFQTTRKQKHDNSKALK
ncbi:hypothetical protein HOLDEFILI_03659 [Holdemania filiformis DSM 12042]|uniref:Uncharacterized protein n=1 Tax=Holdemania filiformis DSM 12042 TaxID=545696 RepID=B9YCU8_9FIRM|nr:hypothetical protein HOLDEFILI_03659 [Holdemania filiformis DSM 12042]